MRNNLEKKFTYFIVPILFISFFGYAYFTTHSKLKEIRSKFPVLQVGDSLNNNVVKKYEYSGFRGTSTYVLVELDKNKFFTINTYFNFDYRDSGINDILEIGDRLIKHSGVDSIMVIKKDKSDRPFYVYELGYEKY
ncbi:MAG: hypothetical protein H6538_03755 [Bacteroidales bacterium]|nr:hypothetical protein [Bacteroidales bacterium]